MREYRKYAIILAVFSAALYAAVIVAAFGVLSLLLDRDVINEADAGTLIGPIMVATAVLALVWIVLRGVVPSPERLAKVPVMPIFVAGLVAYLGYCVSGGVLYGVTNGQFLRSVLFIASEMTAPFAIAVLVCGWLVAFLYFVVLVAKPAGSGAPAWPWERGDDN